MYLSVCLSSCLSVCIYLYICLAVCLSVSVCFCVLSVCLSASPPHYQPETSLPCLESHLDPLHLPLTIALILILTHWHLITAIRPSTHKWMAMTRERHVRLSYYGMCGRYHQCAGMKQVGGKRKHLYFYIYFLFKERKRGKIKDWYVDGVKGI